MNKNKINKKIKQVRALILVVFAGSRSGNSDAFSYNDERDESVYYIF